MTTLGPPSSNSPPKQPHDDAHSSSPNLAVAPASRTAHRFGSYTRRYGWTAQDRERVVDVPGAELRYDSSDRRGTALNSLIGVALEAVNAAIEVMLLPGLVLAFFAAELTPSYATIGLVPAVAFGFWTLARLPALLLTATRRRQQAWAFAAALVRVGAVGILAIVASRTDPGAVAQSARPLLAAFFLCLTVYSLAGGFGSVPATALLRAAAPGDAWASFARMRALWCAVLSVLAALIVARLLGSDAFAFPSGYGRLFLAATVCLVAVAGLTAAIREPAGGATMAPMASMSSRLLRQPLLDPRFRRFLVFRVLLSSSAAVDPFLFLYAVTRLGAPTTAIGGYVVAGVLGWVLTAPVWLWLERRSGARSVLQAATVVRLVAPAVALALPPLAATELMRERFLQESPLISAYGIGFFAIGAALAAQARGTNDYLTALSPRPSLPAYTGLTNAVLTVVAFAPVLGGIMIQRSSYETLFVAALAIGLAAVFAGGALASTPASFAIHQAPDAGEAAAARALPAGRT